MLAIDVETTKKPKMFPWIPGSYLVSVSIANGTKKSSWLFNHPESDKSQKECIEEIQTEIDRSKKIIGHNIKFDLHWLYSIGIKFDNVNIYCTQVAEYILRGQQRKEYGGLSLNNLAKQYGLKQKKDKVKLYWESGYETDEIPANILNEYCEWDCQLALDIYKKQVPQIKKFKLEKLISLDMEAVKVLQQIEYNGMLVDTEMLKEYSKDYERQINEIDNDLIELLGSINLNSRDQLSCALYGGFYLDDEVETVTKTLKDGTRKEYQRKCKKKIKLEGAGFKPLEDTETKKEGFYKTGADILSQLKCRTKKQKEIIKLLLERGKLTKMKSTYLDGLLERQTNSYIHPNMNQTVTVTGRLSSSNPNGQNLPRGSTGPAKQPFISRY